MNTFFSIKKCLFRFSLQLTGIICLFIFTLSYAPHVLAGEGVYTVSSMTLNWETFTGTSVTLSDDDISSAITIPFNFTFYGNSYNQLVISSNGFVSFDINSDNGCCDGETIPGSYLNNIIAGWWTDLYPPGAGTVQYTTLGTTPNRRFIVQFSGIPECCGSTPDVNFEIKLFETTNKIEIHYNGTTTSGGLVTAGIQDDSGVLGEADINSVSAPSKINTATQYVYTPAAAPSVMSPLITNIDATTASFSAHINANGSVTDGYFLWDTQNATCQNLRNKTTSDAYNGGNLYVLSATIYGLTSGTTYYYCPVGVNSLGITYGTVNSFVQTGGSECTNNIPNSDYVISSSCLFPAVVDGVDKGTGSVNNGVLIVNKGTTLTIGSDQTIAYGVFYKPGATVVRFSGGTMRRGPIWIPDSDEDGYPDNADNTDQVVSDAKPSGYIRRSLSPGVVDCSPYDETLWQLLQGATDNDGDSYTATTFTQPVCSGSSLPAEYAPSVSSLDCDDTNINIYQNISSIVADLDNDGYYTGSSANTCVGGSSIINTRSYYKDSLGGYSKIQAGDTLGGSDCSDVDAGKWQNLDGYPDIDSDGIRSPGYVTFCTGNSLPAGYNASGGNDCNDNNASLYTPRADIEEIDVGNYHSCARLSDGTLKCWGENYSGQLGNGTTTKSLTPVSVTGISTATKITAGDELSCARLSDGTVKCWGYNNRGQLGNGTTSSSSTPVSVSGISTAIDIDVANAHACAVLSDGTVKCWGYNANGQLGNGTTSDSSTPVSVTGISTAVQIATGLDSSCARLSDGTLKCWGGNYYGQLGNGTTTTSAPYGLTTPVSVTGISTATQVTVGHSVACAVLSDSTVKCWGYNNYGALGNGTDTDSSTPVSVTGISTATQISASGNENWVQHVCARLSDGTAKCWGNGSSGQLGDGLKSTSNTPVTVSNISNATQVATDNDVSCARLSTGSVQCWGSQNDNYGNGSTFYSAEPVGVINTTSAAQIDTSTNATSCSLLSSGAVQCWGYNYYGQLGNGTTIPEISTPMDVFGISTATEIALGDYFSCARLSDSTVKCWGANSYGQLGNGTYTDSSTPVSVTGISTATQVSIADDYACAVLSDGTVKCWGYNYRGQLGNGTTSNSSTPVSVSGISTATQVSTAYNYACARLSDSTVKCWGYNYTEQLGDGTTTQRSTPVTVSGLSGVSSITAASAYACARLSDSTVKCWGANSYGQLGNGTTSFSSPLVSVTGISTATEIALGDYFSCARLSDSTVKCWGNNGSGQLGDGTTTQRSTPVTVSGLSGVSSITAASAYACARLSDSTVKCWGNNYYGQLGNGTRTTSSPYGLTTPVFVSGISTATQVSTADNYACATLSDGTAKCWGYNYNGELGNGVVSGTKPQTYVCQ